MNTKNNQRVRLTKRLLKEAYVSLMKRNPVSKITVKALCEEAELNRSTFYLHYSEPNDVLKDIENEIIENLSDRFSRISGKENDNRKEVTGPLLRYVKENGELFKVMLLKNDDTHFRNKLVKFAKQETIAKISPRVPMQFDKMVYEYIVGGSMEILSSWVISDFAYSEEEIDQFLNVCAVGIMTIYSRV